MTRSPFSLFRQFRRLPLSARALCLAACAAYLLYRTPPRAGCSDSFIRCRLESSESGAAAIGVLLAIAAALLFWAALRAVLRTGVISRLRYRGTWVDARLNECVTVPALGGSASTVATVHYLDANGFRRSLRLPVPRAVTGTSAQLRYDPAVPSDPTEMRLAPPFQRIGGWRQRAATRRIIRELPLNEDAAGVTPPIRPSRWGTLFTTASRVGRAAVQPGPVPPLAAMIEAAEPEPDPPREPGYAPRRANPAGQPSAQRGSRPNPLDPEVAAQLSQLTRQHTAGRLSDDQLRAAKARLLGL
ncbi:hypothetical protein GCM10022198_02630 [Klugiella xanthotipulae]|uniref:Uncharacterized protein n=1 Tax=Klugiella xanthotipulae TaxID=244735 RepID=A0A543I4S9_9MICO|nr:hypothetical protein [Klugiella xanthotipulae]TQM65603.1 hypothetical protein FB466_0408 [Klugiella xanthotipulae]